MISRKKILVGHPLTENSTEVQNQIGLEIEKVREEEEEERERERSDNSVIYRQNM